MSAILHETSAALPSLQDTTQHCSLVLFNTQTAQYAQVLVSCIAQQLCKDWTTCLLRHKNHHYDASHYAASNSDVISRFASPMNWQSYARPGLAFLKRSCWVTEGRSPRAWYRQLYSLAKLGRASPCNNDSQS